MSSGKLISKQYFDEEGTTLSDTTSKDQEASFRRAESLAEVFNQ